MLPLFAPDEFLRIVTELSGIVERQLAAEGVNTNGFSLQTHHRYVDDAMHYRIVALTRQLYPEDFGIDPQAITRRLGEALGHALDYREPVTGEQKWIIIRIVRPGVSHYNPVHKDIYELYDTEGQLPRMDNFWIPICGVGNATGLPVAPASHRINENRILRFPAGSEMNGKRCRVNNIVSWDGHTDMQTICPAPGQMLVFSSHLIHGIGRNLNADTTRISLEFRLFASEAAAS